MNEIAIFSLIAFWVLACLFRASCVEKSNECYEMYFSPAAIHRQTKMNWFGCVCAYVLLWVVTPFVQFIGVLILFYKFIYWICHVGRKD